MVSLLGVQYYENVKKTNTEAPQFWPFWAYQMKVFLTKGESIRCI
jgi:hypothetical protein